MHQDRAGRNGVDAPILALLVHRSKARGRGLRAPEIGHRHDEIAGANLRTMIRSAPSRGWIRWGLLLSLSATVFVLDGWSGMSVAVAQSAQNQNQNQSAAVLVPYVNLAPARNGRGGIRAVTRPTIMNPTGGRLFGAGAGWSQPVGGYEPNQVRLSQRRSSMPPRKNPDFAVLLASANAGNAAAEFAVGLRYLYGTDGSKDVTKARHWLARAASHHHPNASAILKALPD